MTAHHLHIDQDPETDVHNPGHFKVGTLSYTRAGLITLFVYLLWGDFCWSLMEGVMPSVLPLKLNAFSAPNWVLGLIMTTIPSLMNTVINPIVSFRSDRFRSRWGRRIPFLMGVTPFLVVFLVLLGYSEPISRWIHHAVLGGKWSDSMVTIWVIGVFMVCFQFFNLFTTSIYYYLFNDVVPHAFLARFLALFRIAGGAAGALYSYFIFKYAFDHMALIFSGAALLYLAGFTMMCWKVKEGEYPPPPPNLGNRHGLVASIRTYGTECYTHRFYWFLFLGNSFQSLTWVSGAFGALCAIKYMGFDYEFLGKLGGVSAVIGMILTYPGGIIADRFHPLRVILVTSAIGLLIAPLGLFFIFFWRPHMTLLTAKHVQIALSMTTLPLGVVGGACELPLLMKLFPRERFGQFCSANALIRSISMAIGGVGCGVFLDSMKRFNPNPDYCYRFVSVWNTVAGCGYFFFLFLVYRWWKRLGGMASYQPPSPDLPDEVIAIPETEPVA
ncbi:MAG: MFS transporter [Chthoniobacteraceae bacterium]